MDVILIVIYYRYFFLFFFQKITSFGLLLADGGDIRSGKGAAYCQLGENRKSKEGFKNSFSSNQLKTVVETYPPGFGSVLSQRDSPLRQIATDGRTGIVLQDHGHCLPRCVPQTGKACDPSVDG